MWFGLNRIVQSLWIGLASREIAHDDTSRTHRLSILGVACAILKRSHIVYAQKNEGHYICFGRDFDVWSSIHFGLFRVTIDVAHYSVRASTGYGSVKFDVERHLGRLNSRCRFDCKLFPVRLLDTEFRPSISQSILGRGTRTIFPLSLPKFKLGAHPWMVRIPRDGVSFPFWSLAFVALFITFSFQSKKGITNRCGQADSATSC